MKKFTKEWGKLYLCALSGAEKGDFNAQILESAEKSLTQNSKENEIVENLVGGGFCADDFCEQRLIALKMEENFAKLVFGNGKEMAIEGAKFIENDFEAENAGKSCGFYVLLACELYYTERYEVHLLFYRGDNGADGENGDNGGNDKNDKKDKKDKNGEYGRELKYLTISGSEIFVK